MTARRQFIQAAALAACAPLHVLAGPAPKSRLSIGIAGYSFAHYRNDRDRAIALLKDLGVDAVTLKDFHLPMDASAEQARSIVKSFTEAGIRVYGLGVIYMKDDAEAERAFRYAERAGVGLIIGSPVPTLLPKVERLVKESGIRMAIHNHGPEDAHYPDIDTIHRHIAGLDARIGICLDVGHSFRCGHLPDRMLQRFGSRVIDMHIKDVTVQQPDGASVIPGRGVLPLRDVFHVAQSIGFGGFCSLEYEVPGDPAVGIAESIGYLRGLLKGLAD